VSAGHTLGIITRERVYHNLGVCSMWPSAHQINFCQGKG
jgi:hypothetical protein